MTQSPSCPPPLQLVGSIASRSRSRAAAMLGIQLPHDLSKQLVIGHVSWSNPMWFETTRSPPTSLNPTSRCRIVISLFQRRCFSPSESRNYNGWRQRVLNKNPKTGSLQSAVQHNFNQTKTRSTTMFHQKLQELQELQELQSHFFYIIKYHFVSRGITIIEAFQSSPCHVASPPKGMRRWQRTPFTASLRASEFRWADTAVPMCRPRVQPSHLPWAPWSQGMPWW